MYVKLVSISLQSLPCATLDWWLNTMTVLKTILLPSNSKVSVESMLLLCLGLERTDVINIKKLDRLLSTLSLSYTNWVVFPNITRKIVTTMLLRISSELPAIRVINVSIKENVVCLCLVKLPCFETWPCDQRIYKDRCEYTRNGVKVRCEGTVWRNLLKERCEGTVWGCETAKVVWEQFKPYFCHWPSLTQFESLLSLKSKKWINQLSKYIYHANNLSLK